MLMGVFSMKANAGGHLNWRLDWLYFDKKQIVFE